MDGCVCGRSLSTDSPSLSTEHNTPYPVPVGRSAPYPTHTINPEHNTPYPVPNGRSAPSPSTLLTLSPSLSTDSFAR